MIHLLLTMSSETSGYVLHQVIAQRLLAGNAGAADHIAEAQQ